MSLELQVGQQQGIQGRTQGSACSGRGSQKGRAKQVYQLSCNRIVLDYCASIANRSGLSNTLMLKGSEGCGGKGD
jgi:hypothetical protein